MTKKSNKKFIVILLIVLLLALAVGYAAFTDTLTISGTANVKSGSAFDVHFKNTSEVITSDGCTASVQIGTDGDGDANDLLEVTITDLAYPGAGAQIRAVIENSSSVPVKVTGLEPVGLTGNGSAIVITGLDNVVSVDDVIAANGGTCEIVFTVEWDEDVTTLNTIDSSSHSFELGITYEQDTDLFRDNNNFVEPNNSITYTTPAATPTP